MLAEINRPSRNSISVIIPTYNRADRVTAAVKSALEQSVAPIEIIVCDDGSTDNTEERIASFSDSSVHWLPGEHSGRPAIPRNRGVQAAQGEWLAFLDSDDIWHPKKLELQMRAIEQYACMAACSNAWRVIENLRFDLFLEQERDYLLEFEDLALVNMVVCSSAIVHRSILERVGGFPEEETMKAIEDYGLWLRVATLTPFIFISKPLLDYHDSTTSIRSEVNDDGYVLRCRVWDNFGIWVAKHFFAKKYKTRLRNIRWKIDIKRGLRIVYSRIKAW